MKKLFSAWDKYWFEKIPAYPLAGFRILYGIYLFFYFFRYAPHIVMMFSNQGVYTPFLIPDIAPSPFFAYLIFYFNLLCIFGFIIGFKTKWLTPLVLILFVYHYLLNLAVLNCSFDRLNMIFLFIALWAPLDKVWAVRPSEKYTDDLAAAWPARLIALQMGFMYFGSGFWKLVNPYWHTGTIFQMSINGHWGTSLAFWITRQHLPMSVYAFMTILTIAMELSLGFALYFRRTQKWAMIIGIIFHMTIWFLMDIPEFMNCATTYVLFLPWAEAKKYGERVGTWISSLLNIEIRLKTH